MQTKSWGDYVHHSVRPTPKVVIDSEEVFTVMDTELSRNQAELLLEELTLALNDNGKDEADQPENPAVESISDMLQRVAAELGDKTFPFNDPSLANEDPSFGGIHLMSQEDISQIQKSLDENENLSEVQVFSSFDEMIQSLYPDKQAGEAS